MITPSDLNDVFALIGADRERTVSTAHFAADGVAELIARIEEYIEKKKLEDVLVEFGSPTEPRITLNEANAVIGAIQKHCAGNIVRNIFVSDQQKNFTIDMLCFR